MESGRFGLGGLVKYMYTHHFKGHFLGSCSLIHPSVINIWAPSPVRPKCFIQTSISGSTPPTFINHKDIPKGVLNRSFHRLDTLLSATQERQSTEGR